MRKRILALLVAAAMMVSLSCTAFANEISDKQNMLSGVKGRIGDLKDQISDLSDNIDDNQKTVEDLDQRINNVGSDIRSLQSKIGSVQKKIDSTTVELDAAERDYSKQDQRMKDRINALYKNSTDGGYLGVILESASFAEFISKSDIVQKVVDYDMQMLEEMKQKREMIDKKKAELEQDKRELASDKAQLDYKKEQLVANQNSRKKLIAAYTQQKTQSEKDLEDEEAAAAKITKDILALQDKNKNYDGGKWAILRRSDYPSGKSPKITSTFGSRIDPVTGKRGEFHSGIDIGTGGVTNIPVYAMSGGKVIIARWYGGYGYCVVIDHGSGLASLYGHNNKLLVTEGQTVSGGQRISLSGSTGRSTGPHVHFGIQKNGQYINPAPYLMFGR